MLRVASPSVVRQMGSLFDGGSVVGLSDRQLIERFTDPPRCQRRSRLRRPGGAPWPDGPARLPQLLGDRHHAEDAFQAVFLVLARKARSIRDPDLLGNWLYGVSLRTARKARRKFAPSPGEKTRKRNVGDPPGWESGLMSSNWPNTVLAREQAEALHREIERLPGHFACRSFSATSRALTLEEAARRLRWPAGTVRSRLARACDKLRRGLTRRGIALPTAALAAVLDTRAGVGVGLIPVV